jgi:hypothetical protein
MRIAFEQMVYWLTNDYGLIDPDAYLFLGQVAQARCMHMVRNRIRQNLNSDGLTSREG